MGWTFNLEPQRLTDFLRERCRKEDFLSDGNLYARRCLASKYVMYTPARGTLWTVWEYTVVGCDGTVLKDERYIGCDLIQYGQGVQGCYWGYKDLEASMGPSDISCPLKYLEMVPEPKACACVPKPEPGWEDRTEPGCGRCYERLWRERVRLRHKVMAERRRLVQELRPGDKVYLVRGCSPDVITVRRVDSRGIFGDWVWTKARFVDVKKTREGLVR